MILQHPISMIYGGTPYEEAVRVAAFAAGLCYNVEASEDDRESFVRRRMLAKHDSVIEHNSVSCYFEVDRGVTHEMVRHRLCSFTQSSTRYCNYAGSKEGNNVKIIIPLWCNNIQPGVYGEHDASEYNMLAKCNEAERLWFTTMKRAERSYKELKDEGWAPENMRSVLPNSTMARILWSANLREWRHILNLRAIGTTGRPHPQMVQVMMPLLKEFKDKYPCFFVDIELPLSERG